MNNENLSKQLCEICGIIPKFNELLNKTFQEYYENTDSATVTLCKMRELEMFFGKDTNINEIGDTLIANYKQYLIKKGNSNSTINTKMAVLSSVYKYAYPQYTNIIPKIPFCKINNSAFRVPTNHELKEMFKYCYRTKNNQLKMFILIGIETGFRINEILHFKIEYPYLVLYSTKNGLSHSVPMSKKLLKRYSRNPNDFLFTYKNADAARYEFNCMIDALGFNNGIKDRNKKITPHKLRHYTGTTHAEKGTPPQILQALLNHKSFSSTERYTHIRKEALVQWV